VATDLRKVVEFLRQKSGPSDGQLLARFIAARDEDAFAQLVRRHGRMVLGVCRRVLRNAHDAEDAFQATFLILARKAGSVVQRESVGSWLYRVAYHAALDAAASCARRRSLETQVRNLPHPEVMPDELHDLRPLLDRELSLLPEKYRAAVVLCDLEGWTRREAARQLGIPEGTLSSRLMTAHKLLAKRLARGGLGLSAGGVAVVLAQEAATAAMPSELARTVAKTVMMLPAGSTPAIFLMMKGAFHMLFTSKWWPVAGAVVVALSLAAVGIGFKSGDAPGTAQAAPPEKPMSELEALRKENELLKLNLDIVLEKLKALEAELQTLRGSKGAATGSSDSSAPTSKPGQSSAPATTGSSPGGQTRPPAASSTPTPYGGYKPDTKLSGINEEIIRELEAALKELRDSKDKDVSKGAAEVIEKALKKLRDKPSK
jgi:RNA polymerase sigma factor (sigma-70 family)